MNKFFLTLFLLFNLNLLTANECLPSKWGENDEIGNANLITSESVLNWVSAT